MLVNPVAGCSACRVCADGFATRCSRRRELGIRGAMPGVVVIQPERGALVSRLGAHTVRRVERGRAAPKVLLRI